MAFVDVWSSERQYPNYLVSTGSVRELTVDLEDLELDLELSRMVQRNADILEELIVSVAKGASVLAQTEHFLQMFQNSSRSLCLTLFERTADQRGRVFAKVDIGPRHDTVSRFDYARSQKHYRELYFQQWECDHAPVLRSDYLALVLDMASRTHAAVLTSLILNISYLSSVGIEAFQNLLRNSSLEHLNIVCTPIVPLLSNQIARVLGSVQGPTLKSLVLSGHHLEAWILLWIELEKQTTFNPPRLLSLHIRGSGSAPQHLAHSAVLFIHRLISSSALVELYFQNVLLREERDWGLIVESVDPLLLKTFDLCPSSTTQLQGTGEAWELFQLNFEIAE